MRKLLICVLAALLCGSVIAAAQTEVNDRVVRSAVVLRELSNIPETGIPGDLLNKCACVAVVPSMKKLAFIFGGSYGKGLISCRVDSGTGPWSAPSMILVGGGSFGLQIGGQAVDLVLLIMNVRGLESLLNSKFTLGPDAAVAAGPLGRTAAAQTDAWLSAKILTYSRARGIFAGIDLKGDVVRPDKDANQVLYGKQIVPRETLLYRNAEPIPKDAQIFVDELTRLSPKKLP